MVTIIAKDFITNLGILRLFYTLYKLELLSYFLISITLSAIIGEILFHNQHTFNPSYVVKDEVWLIKNSGIYGSSYIDIPWYLNYFTNGIEYHHIHHISSKIPGYNLKYYHKEVIETYDIFNHVVKLSMKDCYENLFLVLYSEDKHKYITFYELEN